MVNDYADLRWALLQRVPNQVAPLSGPLTDVRPEVERGRGPTNHVHSSEEAERGNMGSRKVWAAVTAVVLGVLTGTAFADDPQPGSDTGADRPYCWLVLYNINSPESIIWVDYYQQLRGIPQENVLGLDASLDEHLGSLAAAEAEIFGPVRDYLTNNPTIEAHIMGILLGYDLPGTYGSVPYGGPGGYAIENGLQDLSDTARDLNLQCAQLGGCMPDHLLQKADLLPQHYLVGRIDAPTHELAITLTMRALVAEDGNHCFTDENVYYDYTDSVLPNSTWYWLQDAVQRAALAEIPWQAFNSDFDQSPNDAMRFGTHDVDGWNDDRLYSSEPGSRILAYNLNSWGATTVRSTDASGGRYVPNALAAGYAAAIGATGEPGSVVGPFPWVLLEGLREGRTLGETMYLANPYDDWVWVCIGDPLLKITNWFDSGDCEQWTLGDLNCDGDTDLYDIDPFVTAIVSPAVYHLTYPACNILNGDANGDGVTDVWDIGAFIALLF